MCWRGRLRNLRRSLKERLPYVRRRNYALLEKECTKLKQEVEYITSAASAEMLVRKTPEVNDYSEVCYFVTYTDKPSLKPHVVHHIKCLIEQGIGVVLIVNFANDQLSEFELDAEFVECLIAVFIRENKGFDFAAWSHALSIFSPRDTSRVFFVNDSIVGPIDDDQFALIVSQARDSSKAVFALTDNPIPVQHFQTFFWGVSGEVFDNPAFCRYMLGVVNLTDKQAVIDKYELGLTSALRELGYEYTVFFENTSPEVNTNQTIFDWESLLARGFPFVKASLFSEQDSLERLVRYVPVDLRPDASEPRHLR